MHFKTRGWENIKNTVLQPVAVADCYASRKIDNFFRRFTDLFFGFVFTASSRFFHGRLLSRQFHLGFDFPYAVPVVPTLPSFYFNGFATHYVSSRPLRPFQYGVYIPKGPRFVQERFDFSKYEQFHNFQYIYLSKKH